MLIEEDIIEKLNSKDKEAKNLAFEKLYNKYYRLVFFIVGKYIKNNEDKEDLVQSVFFKIFQAKNKIKNITSLSSYISTTAKNVAINFLNKNKCLVSLENENTISGEYNIIFIPELSNLLKKEEINIIVLKIYYGYKFKEIAELLDIQLETVATKYYRALDLLKKHYGDE